MNQGITSAFGNLINDSGLNSIFINNILGRGISFTIDDFRMTYVYILTFMWFMSFLFSLEYFKGYRDRTRYYVFTVITYISTIGVFLSADLYTTFLCFEIMSFSSYIWVIHDEKDESIKAGGTYLTIAVASGLVLLTGLMLLQNATGTLDYIYLPTAVPATSQRGQLATAGACIAIGFAAKAGLFPLHIWLPQAHPVAPAPASALLSGALTKTGVFGMILVTINIFVYTETFSTLILFFATVTMVLGAVLGLCAINVKRILACSSMSQIGFISVGIAMLTLLGVEHNTIAARGIYMHMINHSFFKLILFTFAGIMIMNTHKGDLNELKGFGRGKKLLHFGFLMAGMGITGIPMLSGYISKTLLHESVVEYYHLSHNSTIQLVEWLFLFSGGLTLAYILKIYIAIFWEKNENSKIQEEYDNKKNYMTPITAVSYLTGAVIVLIFGLFPTNVVDPILDGGEGFFRVSGLDHDLHYFTWTNLKGSLISIGIGVVIYIFIVRRLQFKEAVVYKEMWPKVLDLELLIYRPIIFYAIPFVFVVIARVADSLVDVIVVVLRKTIYKDKILPYELEEGSMLTHFIGSALDGSLAFHQSITHHRSKRRVSYEHKLAMFRLRLLERNILISRSLSFGLLMFCIGLMITLLYIIFL
ncbi:MAG: complex I subunit 5 family protein [Eubacteriales bacterium]